jgi:mRNA interferase RelE/StbE
MHYNVKLKKAAIKALIKINEPYYSNIKEVIYSLAINPRPLGYKKLIGRVADYRIIYDILDDVLLVEVIDLGHRKDIYE